jgi:hypothetical protein
MPVYVDCADRLERAAGESARLELSEARDLVQTVVAEHPDFDWPEEEAHADIRVRAGKVFNFLLETSWLEDRPESLYERWVGISPALRPLLYMLRELASDSIGELQTFADTLDGVCRTLETDGVLDAAKQSGDALRSTVNDVNTRLAHAISQLHSVEKIVHGFEQRQMQSRTGAETLQLFYSEFYEGQHIVCHEVLHRRGLLNRLYRACEVVREAERNPFAQERLAEGLRAVGVSEEQAWTTAGEELAKVIRALGGIRQRADAVDARIASFHQLSRQRFFYQSEMRGRRPEMARQLCEAINERFAGRRFSDLDGAPLAALTGPWRGLLAPEVELFHGLASLRSARRVRQPVSLSLTDASLPPPDERERARLLEVMRVAVTPMRAARLVQKILPQKGSSVSTSEIAVEDEKTFLDLIAAASFNHDFVDGAIVRWRVVLSHEMADFDRAAVPRDRVGGWKVERFNLSRVA